jgi:hypothetical protein
MGLRRYLKNIFFPAASSNEVRSRRAIVQQQISHIDPLGDVEFNRKRAKETADKAQARKRPE